MVGFHGPLGAVLGTLFANVTAASLFRELFDVTILVWFPFCVLAAVALERVPAVVAAGCTAAICWRARPPRSPRRRSWTHWTARSH